MLLLSSQDEDLRQKVRDSDLIAIGTLQREGEVIDSIAVVNGWLNLEEVLWGDQASYLLSGEPFANRVRVRWPAGREISGSQGSDSDSDRGIWFARRITRYEYELMEHGFVAEEQRIKIEDILLRDWVLIRRNYSATEGELLFDLMVRNAHTSDALIPGFSSSNGILYMHPGVTLTVTYEQPELDSPVTVLPMAGRLLFLSESDEIILQRGDELVVTIDLEELFPLEADNAYTVTFSVDRFGSQSITARLP